MEKQLNNEIWIAKKYQQKLWQKKLKCKKAKIALFEICTFKWYLCDANKHACMHNPVMTKNKKAMNASTTLQNRE